MKTENDDLFTLINSLTKAEKSYFAKYAQKSVKEDGKNNSLMLFKAIAKQKDYDEDILKSELKDTKISAQLPVYKNHLYSQILKSLNSFHSENILSHQLMDKIKSIVILQRKGLFDQCLKQIKKTRKIAEMHDQDLFVLQLIALQKNIELNMREKAEMNEIRERYEEEKCILDKQDNINRYFMLFNMAVSLVEKIGTQRNEEDKEQFNKILEDPYLQNEELAEYYSSKIFFYHTHINYYATKLDYARAYEYVKKEVKLIESYPDKIKLNPINYILNLQEVVYFANQLRHFDDAKEAIRKLRELRAMLGREITKKQEIMIITRTADLELAMMLNNASYEMAEESLEKIEEEYVKVIDDIEHAERLVALYKFAYVHFIIGNYNKSLYWLNTVLNDPHRDKRGDVYAFAKILNLMVHFELGNIDLLEYITNSTYKFLKKRKKLYKIETYFMQLLKKMMNTASEPELKEAYKEFLFNLGRIRNDEFERGAYVYFDFTSWAESKIENKSFREVLERKK